TIGGGGDSDYAWFQGTSMAAPHVTGVVSLLLAADPSMSLADVRSAIVDTARPIEAWKCDRPDATDCGAGSLDAAAALGAAASGTWSGAPTIQFDLFACADETCDEIDGTSVPVATANAVQTRAYAGFAFADLAPGFYLVVVTIDAPSSDFPIQEGGTIFEVLPGEDSNGVVYAGPPIV
ncbi:MAG TPA: S8 family serine peptidase, partial [Trueperaceae bacterium]|nr:S8 family serine peptidase [Trueperaceae bacterium]